MRVFVDIVTVVIAFFVYRLIHGVSLVNLFSLFPRHFIFNLLKNENYGEL